MDQLGISVPRCAYDAKAKMVAHSIRRTNWRGWASTHETEY
jgi:hypothetical protein